MRNLKQPLENLEQQAYAEKIRQSLKSIVKEIIAETLPLGQDFNRGIPREYNFWKPKSKK